MTNTTKLTSSNGSIDEANHGAIEHSSDQELIDSFSRAQRKRFYWSPSLTKSAIVGAGSIGAMAAVGLALVHDANAPQPQETAQDIPTAAIDSATPLPIAALPSSAVTQPSIEFSSHPIASHPIASHPIPRLPAGMPLPPLPVSPSAQAAIRQPLPNLEPPSTQFLYSPSAQAAASQAAASRLLARPDTATRRTLPTAQLLPAAANPMSGAVSPADAPRSTGETPRSPMLTAAISPSATISPSPEESPFQKQSDLQPPSAARLQIAQSIAFTTDRVPEMSPPQFSSNPEAAVTAEPQPRASQAAVEEPVVAQSAAGKPALERPAPEQPDADIRSFIDRSQQPIPPNQAYLLPLTHRAATEVSTADDVAEFRVFHLSAANYAQVWSAVSPASTLPEHGFIDYQRQIIVVPADRPG